jgi:hypothetical protein
MVSITIGTARSPTARWRLPSVKSCSVPRSDSFNEAQKPDFGDGDRPPMTNGSFESMKQHPKKKIPDEAGHRESRMRPAAPRRIRGVKRGC